LNTKCWYVKCGQHNAPHTNILSSLQDSQKKLAENNVKSEAWQETVEGQVGPAELELLKWEYRCRALEQENAGLQRRNAALMNDVRHEIKENKRISRVVAIMLKALVSERSQLREINPAYDASAIENALRLAVSGKEVLWPDRSSFEQGQSLLVPSPDQLHTPTGADAKARAPMRSVSRSINRSKLANNVTSEAGEAEKARRRPYLPVYLPFPCP